jgi:heptaprenyl diphosphate synthase
LKLKTVQIAILVAVASTLFSVEAVIQSPFPWIRLGLANIMTLLALKWWGMREAFAILLMRVFLGCFLTGKFLHPVFVLSLTGGIVSTLAMGVVIIHGKQVFSLIGISLIGSLFKNLTQIFVAYLIYVRHIYIFTLLPLFLLSSLITGIIIGFLTHLIHDKMRPYMFA